MTTTRTVVIGLESADARRLSLVGGKGANLAELLAAGFDVPGGFCVATPAYAEAAAVAGLSDLIDTGGADLAGRAREALLATPVPDGVAAAIAAAYEALGEGVPVAVRSSATAEDLPTASFAGQQDTYLNVVGTDAVLDAVRCCWASLWTDRAVSYRASNAIPHDDVQLAVVVQVMVDVAVAGVLFTADPVSGTRTRSVIDASPGLGEAVVSGAVNPDHVVVDGDATIVEHRIGDKAVEIRALPGGGTESITHADGAQRSALTDGQIRDLVALGRRVEAHYGAPQDIEWAIDTTGTLRLTQSRPITTLYPLPPRHPDGMRAYLNASLAQGLTRPITPMGLSTFRVITSTAAALAFGFPVADPLAGPRAFVVVGGRAFADITPALRSTFGRRVVPNVLNVMETRSAVVIRALLDDPAFAATSASALPALRRVVRALVRFRVPLLLARSVVAPTNARRHVARIGVRLQATMAAPAGGSGADRLDHVERVLATVFAVIPRVVPVAGAGFLMMGLAHRMSDGVLDRDTTNEILRSLPHNSTTEMDLELWSIATRIRADAPSAAALRDTPLADLTVGYRAGTLPAVLQQVLGGFLRVHGHRAVAEIDTGMPRWSDDPSHVLGVLANYLRLDDPDLAPDAQFARGALAAEGALDAVVATVRSRSALRARVVRFALRRVRQLVGMRETHKEYLVRLIAHVRAQLALVGAELAGRGLLADADDIWFLDLREARTALAGADHRAAVTARREEYERELRRRHVPRILLSDGTEPETLAVPAGDGGLIGTPASAGSVTARARVVLDPVGAHLEPGEILVAPSTDPGWTPLFLTAGGLVMEMGGPMSHGAVVAREYGIPAVVGLADATSVIRTGDLVTVDGSAGVVIPADAAPQLD